MEKKEYFKSPEEYYNTYLASDIEKERVFDISDEKWGHPEMLDGWNEAIGTTVLHDPRIPMEEKLAIADEATESMLATLGTGVGGTCDIQSFVVPGCPEEPETEVEVYVYRPKDLNKKKARCMFYLLGGALVMREPAMFPLEEICTRYNCVLVTPMYRTSLQAPYPAAINDSHAAYKWMIDNAEMLRINPNNVMLFGMSSGGHLATALGFRLKRYGYTPKGIVAVVPQVDERENELLSNRIYSFKWDSSVKRQALRQWLGYNFGNSQIGPEAMANHATVEDCIGYPPLFLHTLEFDPDRDSCREFYGKVVEAKTFAEFHCWPGAHHTSPAFNGSCVAGEETPYSKCTKMIINKNIEDCFQYDLRRPWVVDEYYGKRER